MGSLELHPPLFAETVMQPDNPWEGQTLAYPSVLKDGDRYRLYYRASGPPLDVPTTTSAGDQKQMEWSYTALAESRDGIHWTKPKLGLVDFKGSRQNNLVWPTEANEEKISSHSSTTIRRFSQGALQGSRRHHGSRPGSRRLTGRHPLARNAQEP